MTKEVMKELLKVSKGEQLPDAVIRNGKIINVFTNEIEENLAISIKDGWIVSIKKDEKVPTPAGITEIDAKGSYLCPGFIDVHTHLDSMYRFSELPALCDQGRPGTHEVGGALPVEGATQAPVIDLQKKSNQNR